MRTNQLPRALGAALFATAILTTGCATTNSEAEQAMRSDVDRAMQMAEEAQRTAEQAMEAARRAQETADSSEQCCREQEQRLDRALERMQEK
ncbi:alanine-zipper protein [Gilvimarinus sp. F26214L]|uniref:alanine-zipper protein n=1 Tax=Gilvimarinus sp. DZF01 TaxID=3461371 RepID=UPI004045FF65